MKSIRYGSLSLGVALACTACSGDSPQGLASKLDAALKAGDMDAALAVLDSKGLPANGKFFYMAMVPDCFEHLTCVVTAGPVTDDYKKNLEAQKTKQGLEVAPAPEGVLTIKEDGDKEHGSMELPFAKVDGTYKIIAAHYSAQKLGELKAQTGQTLADAALEKGMHTMGGDLNADWKSKASPLPAGGGDAGAAFTTSTNAVAAAAKANDLNAMIVAGGDWAKMVYRDKEFDGKPVSIKRRQLKMRAQVVRQLTDVKVLGGYQQGDIAIITYEGHDGAGWIERGFTVMQHQSDHWESSGGDQVNVPAT